MNIRRDRITSATVGTNHWIWDNPSYLTWQSKTSSAIWICGKAGSGKSVLAKTMQEQLLTKASATTQSFICSWFYSARDNLTLHRQMFSAVLHQILSQAVELFQCVKDTYREWLADQGNQPSSGWPIASLKKALQDIFAELTDERKSLLIILDGLDEGNALDNGHDCSRRDALDFMLGMTSAQLPLKIIFLSRPSDDIKRVLKRQLFISMHTVNRPDIILLIERGVQALARELDGQDSDDECSPAQSPISARSATFGPATSDSIPVEYFANANWEKTAILSDIDSHLKANARGVVLWVTTVLSMLRRKCKEPFCDLKSLRDELKSLPLELTDLYSRTTLSLLQSFKGSQSVVEKSRRSLMWVSVCSKYRLQLQDLLEILSHDFSSEVITKKSTVFAGFAGWASFKRKIEILCGPFIEVVPIICRENVENPEPTRWDLLQLPHESVRAFLQQDKNSLALGFSEAEAEQVVRLERRKYMRRTLPCLEPMLLSSRHTEDDPHRYCQYMESRPLLCFILTTFEFELRHIISQPGGKRHIADILNKYNSISATPRIAIEKGRRPRAGAEIMHSPLTWIFPFLSASALLRACGFLQFSDPAIPLADTTGIKHGGGGDLLEQLFFCACSEGQLNAVNALSSLLVYPQSPKRSILCAMIDAAHEMGLTREPWILRAFWDQHSSYRPRCFQNEDRGPITSSIKVEAAISQVFDQQIFNRGAVGFWTTLAELEASSLPLLWANSHSYQSQLRSLKTREECSIYRRTPFTSLYPPAK